MVVGHFELILWGRTGWGVNRVAQAKEMSANYVAQLEAVLFDLVLEGPAADAEEFRCLGSILIGFV